MKKLLPTLSFLLLITISYGQKMPLDYFEEAKTYLENKQIPKAIASYRYIIDHHPKNELYPKACYNLGYLYYSAERYDSAITIFNNILTSNFEDRDDSGNSDIMANPYANYKHLAASILYNIYYKKEVYDSALYYLTLSDKTYPMIHFCGNAYAENDIVLALGYADIYEKLNKPYEVEKALLSQVFNNQLTNNTAVLNKLISYYDKQENPKKIKAEFEKALKNTHLKKEKNNPSSYYIKFHGVKIELQVGIEYLLWNHEILKKEQYIAAAKKSPFYIMLSALAGE